MGVFILSWIAKIDRPLRNLVFRCSVFIVYLLIGAAAFQALECVQEHKEVHMIEASKLRMRRVYNINDTDLEKFILEVKQAVNDGYFDVDFDRWSFFGSIFFAASVLTTIGYGHIAPRTIWGRVFCMFYAFIGIPITGLMLRSIGDHLVDLIDRLVGCVDRRVLKREKPQSTFVRTSIILFVLMVSMILMLAGLSTVYENWSLFEGIYFSFITLSTIGFGDFVPTEPKGEGVGHHAHVALFVMVTFVYITVGLSVVSSVLVSISRILETSEGTWLSVGQGEEDEDEEAKDENKNFRDEELDDIASEKSSLLSKTRDDDD